MKITSAARLAAATLALAGATVSASAQAQSIPRVYVSSSDDDDGGNNDCSLHHSDMVYAVESALRSNGVSIGNQDDYFADRALVMYVSVTAIRSKTNSGDYLSHCAAYLDLELSTSTKLVNPVTGGNHWTTMTFCDVGTLFNWQVDGIRQRSEEEFRDLTRQCLDKYRGTVRS